MFEVTVDPEDTSELDDSGIPDQNHWTWGLGRPAKRKRVLFFHSNWSLYLLSATTITSSEAMHLDVSHFDAMSTQHTSFFFFFWAFSEEIVPHL